MKQNLKLTNSLRSSIVVVIFTVVVSVFGCATRPRSHSSASQVSAETSANQRASLINVNTATASELEKLPGIGKVIAERIIAQREQYGPFRRAEHLMLVRGISDRKFREIRSMIVAE